MAMVDGSYAVLARLLAERYRLAHHMLYVGLILFFWFLFSIQRLESLADVVKLVLYSATYVGIAYLNIYYFFPRLLLRGRPLLYAGMSGLSFVTSYLAQNFIYFKGCAELKSDLT